MYKLIDDQPVSDERVFITGKRRNMVLLAENDWSAINKILHLLSVLGVRDSIIVGMQKKTGDCAAELEW